MFYVFSNDLVWAQKNLKISTKATFFFVDNSNNKQAAITDLYLMSSCKHHIIANSTFSWWAAYLNPNPDKIIIAPKRWFNKANFNTKDLIPSPWIQL